MIYLISLFITLMIVVPVFYKVMRTQPAISQATTEELERWNDAWNDVAELDNDDSLIAALEAAERTVPWATGKVRKQTRGRCTYCGVRNNASQHMSWCAEAPRVRGWGGHTPPPKGLGIPEKPPKPHTFWKDCPNCPGVTPRELVDGRCQRCGYEEPPDGTGLFMPLDQRYPVQIVGNKVTAWSSNNPGKLQGY